MAEGALRFCQEASNPSAEDREAGGGQSGGCVLIREHARGLWERRGREPRLHEVVKERSQVGTFKVGFTE